MDEKTEELRNIFLSVSDSEAVTESQENERGSLTDDPDAVETRLRDGIDQLREKFGFETDLSDTLRCELIERFYDGETDAEIARALDRDVETVFDARLELHLLRDDEPGLDERLCERIREHPDIAPEDLAETTDATAVDIRRGRAVLAAEKRSRRVSQRFRTMFEQTVTDAELTDQYAPDTRDDGLADATDGAETDVDF